MPQEGPLSLRDSLEIPGDNSLTATAELAAKDHPVGVTDHEAIVYERVGDLLFDYQAHSFLQNNDNVLVPLTSYVRDAIFPSTFVSSSPPRPTSWTLSAAQACLCSPPPHSLDRLSGSGSSQTRSASCHRTQLNGFRAQSHSVLATRRRSLARRRISSLTFYFPPARVRMALVIDLPHTRCDGGMTTACLLHADHRIRELRCANAG
jgi:hypothetical protein